ncbi:hypothetical protein F5146DRAFT_325376 [Armillaria mellea]|nr:hypothetical protein F5146DRAFT_325376 [Armillaria mellea]
MQGSRGRKHLSVTLDPTSKLSSRIPISRNRGKLASRSTRAELRPCWHHLYKFTNSRISIISCTMFFRTFTALLAATVVASSPLAARDAGPKCTIVVTPKDSSYAAGAANQLTYGSSSDSANHGTTVETLAAPGFLYRFGQPTYPDGTSVTSISVSPAQSSTVAIPLTFCTKLAYGPSVTSNNDGTYTVITALTAAGLTLDQIATVIEEQWPETWVWGDSNPGYDWYMNSTAC